MGRANKWVKNIERERDDRVSRTKGKRIVKIARDNYSVRKRRNKVGQQDGRTT